VGVLRRSDPVDALRRRASLAPLIGEVQRRPTPPKERTGDRAIPEAHARGDTAAGIDAMVEAPQETRTSHRTTAGQVPHFANMLAFGDRCAACSSNRPDRAFASASRATGPCGDG
jgi:hypothetical protein